MRPTYPFNFSGQPAASVRAGFTANGLPCGLQIVADRHRDALVLQAAQAYEQARPWNDHWPATAPDTTSRLSAYVRVASRSNVLGASNEPRAYRSPAASWTARWLRTHSLTRATAADLPLVLFVISALVGLWAAPNLGAGLVRLFLFSKVHSFFPIKSFRTLSVRTYAKAFCACPSASSGFRQHGTLRL